MLSELVETTESEAAESERTEPRGVLTRLRALCEVRGLEGLARHLVDLEQLVSDDLERIGEELLLVHSERRLAERAGTHVLRTGGKRVRPLCVSLASRVGAGFSRSSLELAVAAELVHHATLLHDDVVDTAPSRRGVPAARIEFGNTASIFAGDWLLIEALTRVQRAGMSGVLDRLLETLAEMIRAESMQLELRGRLDIDRGQYLEIVRGKSASLFRWAMAAGAQAGGLDSDQAEALGEFGLHLGIAFQVVDDLLDLIGAAADTGKELFADLREGKTTYPMILALERSDSLGSLVGRMVEDFGGASADGLRSEVSDQVQAILHNCGAVDASRALAADHVARANRALLRLPKGDATIALAAVAESTVDRTH